jgi:hypothetical protein
VAVAPALGAAPGEEAREADDEVVAAELEVRAANSVARARIAAATSLLDACDAFSPADATGGTRVDEVAPEEALPSWVLRDEPAPRATAPPAPAARPLPEPHDSAAVVRELVSGLASLDAAELRAQPGILSAALEVLRAHAAKFEATRGGEGELGAEFTLPNAAMGDARDSEDEDEERVRHEEEEAAAAAAAAAALARHGSALDGGARITLFPGWPPEIRADHVSAHDQAAAMDGTASSEEEEEEEEAESEARRAPTRDAALSESFHAALAAADDVLEQQRRALSELRATLTTELRDSGSPARSSPAKAPSGSPLAPLPPGSPTALAAAD